MDPAQITKPFLVVVVCYVLFLLLVFACIPTMTFATLDSSLNQPEPGPQMQLPPQPQTESEPEPEPQPQPQPQPEPGPQMQLPPQPQPQPDFQPFNQDPFRSRSRHLVLNLTEQITFQESTENTPSPFELMISSDQRSANIVAGDTAQAALTVGLASGNTQPVSLSCNLSPPSTEASCNISPSTVTPVGTANLTISTQDTISPGQYTAAITATPERGINQTTNFVIVVDAKPDTNPPVISVPSRTIQVNASGLSGAQVQYRASATDDVDGSINVTCIPPSGSTFPIGETIVECSAADAAGNTGSGSFTITIQDTTPPAISVPDDIIAEATSPNGEQVPFEVSAQDDVDGAVEVISCDHNSGETFPIGETVVTCNTVDAAGNTATASFTVTVNPAPDTTPPEIIVPEDIVVEATSEQGAVVTYTVTAQDDRDGTLPVVECIPASDSSFAIDTTIVNCEATDAAGNTATASFTVTVNPAPDTMPPEITVPTEDITVEAAIGAEGAEVSFEVSAQDDVDGAVEVSCDHNSGETFPIGETVVTCNATDSSGNPAEESFNITVVGPVTEEDTVPVITGPTTPIEVEATSNAGEEVSYTVTALDTEDGSLIPQCDPPSGSIFRIGETVVRCNVIDTAGNFVSEDFPVIVRGPQDGPSLLFIIIALIIAAIVVAVVIILLIRRRRIRSSTDVDDEGTRVY